MPTSPNHEMTTTAPDLIPERFIRESECRRMTGLSRVTRWRKERRGEFPGRIQISANAVAWRESEVIEWMAALQRVAPAMGGPADA
jgi:prophage regulatory protein